MNQSSSVTNTSADTSTSTVTINSTTTLDNALSSISTNTTPSISTAIVTSTLDIEKNATEKSEMSNDTENETFADSTDTSNNQGTGDRPIIVCYWSLAEGENATRYKCTP